MLKEELISTVKKLYKKGEYGYVLLNYAYKNYWIEKIKKILPNNYIENQTDFNYSTCYTTYINVSDVAAGYLDRNFDEYIKNNGKLYLIVLNVSAIAPYATFTYHYYTFEVGEKKVYTSYSPFTEEDSQVGVQLKNFLHNLGIKVLQDKELLSLIVPGVTLELKKDRVTIYHCLFEDGDFEL